MFQRARVLGAYRTAITSSFSGWNWIASTPFCGVVSCSSDVGLVFCTLHSSTRPAMSPEARRGCLLRLKLQRSSLWDHRTTTTLAVCPWNVCATCSVSTCTTTTRSWQP